MIPPREYRKRTKPNGLPRSPFNPATGTYVPLGDPRIFRRFEVVQVGHDALLCEIDGRQVLVAKPWAFRKSEFHEQEFDGTTYGSVELDERTVSVTDPASFTVERVTPAYLVGETIVAMRQDESEQPDLAVAADELEGVSAGTYKSAWEDMNTAGRRWGCSRVRVKIVSISDNSLSVILLENTDAEGAGGAEAGGATAFSVWRAVHLQRQTYDGETINGVTYTYVDAQTRTASDGVEADETQKVTPPYVVGDTILVGTVENGPAVGADQLGYVDLTPRQWAWDQDA